MPCLVRYIIYSTRWNFFRNNQLIRSGLNIEPVLFFIEIGTLFTGLKFVMFDSSFRQREEREKRFAMQHAKRMEEEERRRQQLEQKARQVKKNQEEVKKQKEEEERKKRAIREAKQNEAEARRLKEEEEHRRKVREQIEEEERR